MQAIVLIGVPASGKSTIAQQYAKDNNGSIILSADAVRLALYGDAGLQGNPDRVFAVFYEQLEAALTERWENIIIDNTNVRARYRKQLMEYFSRFCYTTEYWLVDTPFEECLARNSRRARVVPEDVIAKMQKCLQENKPLLSSECSAVYSVSVAGDSVLKVVLS